MEKVDAVSSSRKNRFLTLIIVLGILALLVFVLVIGFSKDSLLLQVTNSPSSGIPPLTPKQITEVRDYINRGMSHWDNGEDVYDEFDSDEMPKSIETHFKNRLKSLGSMMIGCWALPNTNRPIDRDNLKNWGERLENAADRDDDNNQRSINPSDWDLETELNAVENEAKGLIAKWCNQEQPTNAREFCPCLFNCAGTDNSGKTWSSTAYTCKDDCIAPKRCDTATCNCVEDKPANGDSGIQPANK